MLRHMREANAARAQIGRGPFKRGQKVVRETVELHDFGCLDSLEDHATDVETAAISSRSRSRGGIIGPKFRAARTRKRKRVSINEWRQATFNQDEEQHNVLSTLHTLDSGQRETMLPLCDSRAYERPLRTTQNTSIDPRLSVTNNSFLKGVTRNEEMVERNSEDDNLLRTMNRHLDGVDNSEVDDGHTKSRIPGFTQWLKENVGWVELFYKHGLTHTTMDDILALLNSPCRSWKTVMSNITESSPVRVRDYVVCPGHMCYATLHGMPEVKTCSVRGKQKPSPNTNRADETVPYIPLIPRFKAMISDPIISEQLFEYREDLTSSEGNVYRDFYDSEVFRSLCDQHGGAENMKHDLFIAASTDGFQAFKSKSCDVWPLIAVLFNLPPDVRFLAKNVLPLMFIPNEVQPKNLQSFLLPFINESMASAVKGGVEAALPDGSIIRFRIHLIWFSADLAALVKLAGVTGHTGRFPCRFCMIEGRYSSDHQHYYYPALLKLTNEAETPTRLYDPKHLKARTPEHTKKVFERLNAARNITERKRIGTETGVKGRSVLFALPSMKPFQCFPIDIMHLFYNVGMELMRHHLSNSGDGFCVEASALNHLDSEILRFADGISGQLGTKPRALSCFTNWKAAEHKTFTLSYSLVIFDGYLRKECLDGLHMFVSLVDICFRSCVTRSQSLEVKRLSVKFIEHFESYYVKHDLSRINFCKYVIHLLLHLSESIRQYGPLISASQYWVEKYIGWILGRSNAKTLPAKSMLQSAWFGDAKRLFFRERFHKLPSSPQEVVDAGGYMFLGPRRKVRLREIDSEVKLVELIGSYFVRKHAHEGLHPNLARLIARKVETVTLWSRLKFICGSDIQIASSAKPVDVTLHRQELTRPSFYVSVEMDANESTIDVYYGKVLRMMEFNVDVDGGNVSETTVCNGRYELGVIQWVDGLSLGAQGQVFKRGQRCSAFGRTTIEDVTIIHRLIGVVEHAVPVTSLPTSDRKRKQTYFIDDFQRIDHLLSRTRLSDDGVNRRLKGF